MYLPTGSLGHGELPYVWVPNKRCGNSVSLDPKPKVFGEIWIGLVSPPNLNYLEINLEKFPPEPNDGYAMKLAGGTQG